MSSFSNMFAGLDDVLFDVLGDDIVIEHADGKRHKIHAMFDYSVEDEELSGSIGDTHPKLTEIKHESGVLFKDWETSTIIYNGIRYSILDFRSVHDRNYSADLRVERV